MINHIRTHKKPYIVKHIWLTIYDWAYIRYVKIKDKGYKFSDKGTNLLMDQGYKSMMMGTSWVQVGYKS